MVAAVAQEKKWWGQFIYVEDGLHPVFRELFCDRSEQPSAKGEMPGQTSTKCIHALSVEF
jgi:hypothetical protein